MFTVGTEPAQKQHVGKLKCLIISDLGEAQGPRRKSLMRNDLR